MRDATKRQSKLMELYLGLHGDGSVALGTGVGAELGVAADAHWFAFMADKLLPSEVLPTVETVRAVCHRRCERKTGETIQHERRVLHTPTRGTLPEINTWGAVSAFSGAPETAFEPAAFFCHDTLIIFCQKYPVPLKCLEQSRQVCMSACTAACSRTGLLHS